MNLKKQIHRLLTLEFLSCFHPAGCAWVALLSLRGFTLVEIGVAEGFFHAVSLCCELPSGMVADLLGRKRALAAGQCMCALTALAMIFSRSLAGVCLAMAFSAISYNLASGTREALTYDSLLQEGEEARYLRLSSTQNVVYRLSGAMALLCAGLTLAVGHMGSYCVDFLISLVSVGMALSLTEPVVTAAQETRDKMRLRELPAGLASCCQDAVDFLRRTPRAVGIMLGNAVIGACATLLGFYLQNALITAGAAQVALGPLLLVVTLGNATGSKLAPLLERLPYWASGVICATGVGLGLALVLTGSPLLMTLGGFTAGAADDCFEMLTDARLNHMIPSDRRATLISVSSMCFSLMMVGLSPLGGLLAGGG